MFGLWRVGGLMKKPIQEQPMKVKELIEELSKLDPEKGIWCVYDSYALIDLVPDAVATKEEVELFENEGLKEGDYIINVF